MSDDTTQRLEAEGERLRREALAALADQKKPTVSGWPYWLWLTAAGIFAGFVLGKGAASLMLAGDLTTAADAAENARTRFEVLGLLGLLAIVPTAFSSFLPHQVGENNKHKVRLGAKVSGLVSKIDPPRQTYHAGTSSTSAPEMTVSFEAAEGQTHTVTWHPDTWTFLLTPSSRVMRAYTKRFLGRVVPVYFAPDDPDDALVCTHGAWSVGSLFYLVSLTLMIAALTIAVTGLLALSAL